MIGEKEVGADAGLGRAVGVPGENELDRLVLPGDLVEVEKLGEKRLGLMGKRCPVPGWSLLAQRPQEGAMQG
ncbi:MAG: hypothetical protein ACRD0B_01715 [Acidimicrobiales bacterium]